MRKKINLKRALREHDFNFNELDEPVPELLRYSNGDLVSPYHSKKDEALFNISHNFSFKMLAWSSGVRHVLYDPEEDVLIRDTEGDIDILWGPEPQYIKEILNSYPKSQISYGEYFDDRFPEMEPSEV